MLENKLSRLRAEEILDQSKTEQSIIEIFLNDATFINESVTSNDLDMAVKQFDIKDNPKINELIEKNQDFR